MDAQKILKAVGRGRNRMERNSENLLDKNKNILKPFCNVCKKEVEFIRQLPKEQSEDLFSSVMLIPFTSFYVECHKEQLVFALDENRKIQNCFLFGKDGSYYED